MNWWEILIVSFLGGLTFLLFLIWAFKYDANGRWWIPIGLLGIGTVILLLIFLLKKDTDDEKEKCLPEWEEECNASLSCPEGTEKYYNCKVTNHGVEQNCGCLSPEECQPGWETDCKLNCPEGTELHYSCTPTENGNVISCECRTVFDDPSDIRCSDCGPDCDAACTAHVGPGCRQREFGCSMIDGVPHATCECKQYAPQFECTSEQCRNGECEQICKDQFGGTCNIINFNCFNGEILQCECAD